MTAVVEDSETTPAVRETSPDDLAPWYVRAGALAVDVIPGLAVVATMALVWPTLPLHSAWWWSIASVGGFAILVMAVNRSLLPAVTGWSLGRALCRIVVVRRDGAAVGPWRLLLRDLAHLLDTLSVFVGWLWPLWDPRRRTFADLLLHTEVRRLEPEQVPRNRRRLTAGVMLTTALLCVGGAALGYAVVYRHDQAIEQTRAQIATKGPKIVEDILSYEPKSLDDDFARARSLTTDTYGEQLAAQQETVKKGQPVSNEYWVTNSSIQSATPDRATMLLFMQGQRGAPPHQRYISATVRVSFTKSADARWLVDELTVVTKPNQGGGGK